jgi:predicted lipoprotein with Yx(FWY)xxD motif
MSIFKTLAGRSLAATAVVLLVAACSAGATATPFVSIPTAAASLPAASAPAASGPAGSAATGSADVSVASGILVGPTGMALYTHAGDSATSSTCTGGCLTAWPALTVSGATPTAGSGVTGTLATLTRSDNGATQVTYNGKPLYYFASDSTPGQASGDGVAGFSVAKP